MRHFLFLALPIAALAGGMGEAPAPALLIAPSGPLQRSPPSLPRTVASAVDIAPVTVAAQGDLAVTTGTVEKTGCEFHRQLPPMRAGPVSAGEGYLLSGRATHGLGAWQRLDCGGRGRCHACLNGPDGLTDSTHNVIPWLATGGVQTKTLPAPSLASPLFSRKSADPP
jgi:hypothetical protein